MDNLRKRLLRDMADSKSNAKIDATSPFLSVFDHFKLAVKASDEKHSFDVLHKGMEMILDEFQKAFDEVGIEIINACGAVFDPNLHEAAGQKNSTEIPEGHVIEQWRCGYKLGEKIIRPAVVVISSGAAAQNPQENTETADGEDKPNE
jgi:molecular chaperone GrpE